MAEEPDHDPRPGRAPRSGRPGGSRRPRQEPAAGRSRRDGDERRGPSTRRGGAPSRGRGRQGGGGRAGSARGAAARQQHEGVASSRIVAYEVLTQVEEADAYANLVLPGLLRDRGITGRDAAFATELTYGTLRLRGRYDGVLALVSDRPVPELDAPVARVLRLGAHQLLGMRVADHAAVSESVALARRVAGNGPATFVNAILRRISAHRVAHWIDRLGPVVTPSGLEVRAAAVVHSHPRWMVRAIRAALGPDTTPQEVETALAANNEAPAVTLCLRPGLATAQDLPAGTGEPARWAPSAWRMTAGGDPGALPAVRTGAAAVQDEGSQLVTLALAAVELDGADQTWLDLCAGPGGKAALLGALLAQRHPEGELVANEVAPHRARLVQDSVRAVAEVLPGLHVRTGDGRDVGTAEPGRYDRVLVDAPCTGMGALRRRPEARWRRGPQDLATLGPLQRDLLTSALQAVRRGGVVGYVTCSPHPAETDVVVQDVLGRFPGAHLLDAPAALAQVSGQQVVTTDGPTAQLWPHRHGTDAMYLALIRR